jgi:hypothetical protein
LQAKLFNCEELKELGAWRGRKNATLQDGQRNLAIIPALLATN